jgi:hypothetical protein
MYATGVGGGITGFRANVILVDDPHPTWEDAQSATHRRRVTEWFDGTLYDRGEPGATIVVLMHRWHEGDLAGHLIEEHEDDWQVIRLPALAEDEGDPLGRKPGEPLCPERYDRSALLATAAAVGKQVWAAKYQQDPLAVGGGRVYLSVPARAKRRQAARAASRPAGARVVRLQLQPGHARDRRPAPCRCRRDHRLPRGARPVHAGAGLPDGDDRAARARRRERRAASRSHGRSFGCTATRPATRTGPRRR